MPLPPKFTKFTTASQAIASYNYTDIDNGIGFRTYYGARTATSSGEEFILSDTVIESAGRDFGGDLGNNKQIVNGETKTVKLSSFNTSKTVSGTATIEASGFFNTGHTNNKFAVKLQHYDGSTTTDITSSITTETINATTFGTGNYTFSIQLPITEKVFSKGDILQLEITVTSGGSNNGIWFDPVNHPFKLHIPFKLDI